MSDVVTLKLDINKYNEIKRFYFDAFVEAKGEYVDFIAKKNNVVITGYLSNKQTKKITFAGLNALKEAQKWDKNITSEPKKAKTVQEDWLDLNNQIGSDEVGVGDLLLPMIVVAAYVKKEDVNYLIELGVHDSKKLTDEKILKIAPLLIEKFDYSKLTLSNEKYNEMINKGENINSLKAKMHNRALYNLVSKYPNVESIYVDEFASKKTYYKYLNDKNEPTVRNIVFKTKGESYFPCVALASVLARYSFLIELKNLEKKYHLKFPLGASSKVDEFSKKFIKKYGIDEFKKIAKFNFKNISRIIR